MNILLLTQYYKPEMGAPQNRLFEMATGLVSNGCDLTIVTGMPNYPFGSIFSKYKGKFKVKEEIDDIPCIRYWLYASNSKNKVSRILNMLSFSLTSLFSYFHLRKRKIDIVIVESPPLTLGVTGHILAKLLRARLIMNISDLWPLSAKELGALSENGTVYRLLEKLERFLYRKSALCMGQSSEIVEYVKKHGASDVYLFRNGVDPERFNIDSVKKKRESNQPLRIIYAGLLGFAQGILDICKNVNFSNLGVEFHIYGAGGEQKALEEYLAKSGDNSIVYHGNVSRDEIPKILLEYDITLIPLVTNIFGAVPSKIYESMAAGLPILFSGEGEGKKIVEENDLGWVSGARDYKALERNISYVLSHPDEIDSKRNNCISCAQYKFNRPKQVEALHNYLKSLS